MPWVSKPRYRPYLCQNRSRCCHIRDAARTSLVLQARRITVMAFFGKQLPCLTRTLHRFLQDACSTHPWLCVWHSMEKCEKASKCGKHRQIISRQLSYLLVGVAKQRVGQAVLLLPGSLQQHKETNSVCLSRKVNANAEGRPAAAAAAAAVGAVRLAINQSVSEAVTQSRHMRRLRSPFRRYKALRSCCAHYATGYNKTVGG